MTACGHVAHGHRVREHGIDQFLRPVACAAAVRIFSIHRGSKDVLLPKAASVRPTAKDCTELCVCRAVCWPRAGSACRAWLPTVQEASFERDDKLVVHVGVDAARPVFLVLICFIVHSALHNELNTCMNTLCSGITLRCLWNVKTYPENISIQKAHQKFPMSVASSSLLRMARMRTRTRIHAVRRVQSEHESGCSVPRVPARIASPTPPLRQKVTGGTGAPDDEGYR